MAASRIFLPVVPGLLVTALLAASPARSADMWRPSYNWGTSIESPSVRARVQRHFSYMYNGVPERFKDARPPVPATPERISEGREIYAGYCASCHRMDGSGGGDAALGLAPSPALLTYLVKRDGAADEYLMWSIAEGGGRFKTAMPAFENRLSPDEIWKVVAFMRAGFPEGPGESAPAGPAKSR